MNWLFLTVIAIISRAIYGVSTKVVSRNVNASPVTQSVIFSIFATILSLLLCPFIGGFSFHEITPVWWLVVIMVLSMSLGNVLYYMGILSLDSSITQIAFSSILLWGTMLSYLFLNTTFSIYQGVGIFILMIALILIQLQNKKLKLNKGILFIIMSTASFSVFQVSSAELANTISAGTYLVLAYLGSALVVGTAYSKLIGKELHLLMKQKSKSFWIMLFAAITNTIYFVFAYFAYKIAPDKGIVVILLASQVVIAVLLSIVFLRERERIGRKLLAGALAVIAGILIKG